MSKPIRINRYFLRNDQIELARRGWQIGKCLALAIGLCIIMILLMLGNIVQNAQELPLNDFKGTLVLAIICLGPMLLASIAAIGLIQDFRRTGHIRKMAESQEGQELLNEGDALRARWKTLLHLQATTPEFKKFLSQGMSEKDPSVPLPPPSRPISFTMLERIFDEETAELLRLSQDLHERQRAHLETLFQAHPERNPLHGLDTSLLSPTQPIIL